MHVQVSNAVRISLEVNYSLTAFQDRTHSVLYLKKSWSKGLTVADRVVMLVKRLKKGRVEVTPYSAPRT